MFDSKYMFCNGQIYFDASGNVNLMTILKILIQTFLGFILSDPNQEIMFIPSSRLIQNNRGIIFIS